MMTQTVLSAAGAAALFSAVAFASVPPITQEEIAAAQQAWGEGIVHIGRTHVEGGDVEAAARAHIETFYGFGERPVLFKPTLAANPRFRMSFDDALSYFIGGGHEEDAGFALAPFTDVQWDNAGTVIDSDSALAMGAYVFTRADGSQVTVEYSFGYERNDEGDLIIVLHHSSLPYQPQ